MEGKFAEVTDHDAEVTSDGTESLLDAADHSEDNTIKHVPDTRVAKDVVNRKAAFYG